MVVSRESWVIVGSRECGGSPGSKAHDRPVCGDQAEACVLRSDGLSPPPSRARRSQDATPGAVSTSQNRDRGHPGFCYPLMMMQPSSMGHPAGGSGEGGPWVAGRGRGVGAKALLPLGEKVRVRSTWWVAGSPTALKPAP